MGGSTARCLDGRPVDWQPVCEIDPLNPSVDQSATVGEQSVVLLMQMLKATRFAWSASSLATSASELEESSLRRHAETAFANRHVVDVPKPVLTHRVDQELFIVGHL
jgi:hypothetical protein